MRVRDVMTPDVITITGTTPLKEAAVVMTRHRISGLPVLEDGRLVGIITESDFVTRLAGEGEGLASLLFGRRQQEGAGTVADAMTPGPVTISPDETVSVAARRMADRKVKRLPVVDGEGNLVGVVSRADLVSVFARPDDHIAAEVVRDGVVGLLGADPEALAVSVENGVVHLSGTLGSVLEKRMLEEFARQVAGVVGIESRLEAAFDETRLPPM
ncbi:MAG: CBS domain-containing protein [Actinomycetota bacterium]